MLVSHRARGTDRNNLLWFVLKTELTNDGAITEASASCSQRERKIQAVLYSTP